MVISNPKGEASQTAHRGNDACADQFTWDCDDDVPTTDWIPICRSRGINANTRPRPRLLEPPSENATTDHAQAERQIWTQVQQATKACRLHPSAVVLYGGDNDTYVVSESHPVVQRVSAPSMFRAGYRQALVGHSAERDFNNAGAEEDSDVEPILSERNRIRNVAKATCIKRQPHSRLHKRSRTSPTPLSGKRRKSSATASSIEDIEYSEDGEETDLMDEFELLFIDEFETVPVQVMQVRVDRVKDDYYLPAVRSLSQLALKDILKAWIKHCCPKKQTQYPYNGGKSWELSRANVLEYDPEGIHWYKGHQKMPPWWPSDWKWWYGEGCRHSEPDHIKRLERVILFMHLLREVEQHKFTLENLTRSTATLLQNTRHVEPKHMDRLQEIYRVRSKEIDYEAGVIDGDTLITVNMPQDVKKGKNGAKSKKPEILTKAPAANVRPKKSLVSKQAKRNANHKEVDAFTGSDNGEETEIIGNGESPGGVAVVKPEASTAMMPHSSHAPSHGLPTLGSLEQHPLGGTIKLYGPATNTLFLDSIQLDNPKPEQQSIFNQQSAIGHRAMENANPGSFRPTPTHSPDTASHDPSVIASQHFATPPNQLIPARHSRPSQISGHSPRHDRNINSLTQTMPQVTDSYARPATPRNTFAGSSSGLSGLDSLSSSWVTGELYSAQQQQSPYGNIYPTTADASAAAFPRSVNTSFSSDATDSSMENGYGMESYPVGATAHMQLSGVQGMPYVATNQMPQTHFRDEEMAQRFPTYQGSSYLSLSTEQAMQTFPGWEVVDQPNPFSAGPRQP